MNTQLQIEITSDGSHSIFNRELNEHYHSVQGAVAESKHVFIKNGISRLDKQMLNIFEVGFGTGLNVLLTYEYAIENRLNVNYFCIEKFPLKPELTNRLNYASLLSLDNNVFQRMHECRWSTREKIAENFQLTKFWEDLSSFDFQNLPELDLVYFDAFSPSKQPEMWTEDIFMKIFKQMNKGGLLTTYSSAGVVKRALRTAGFIVERRPGAHGKFHMLNAFKP